jgi:hypothetical protein
MGAIADSQQAVDPLPVILDGHGTDPENLRHLLVAFPLAQPADDLGRARSAAASVADEPKPTRSASVGWSTGFGLATAGSPVWLLTSAILPEVAIILMPALVSAAGNAEPTGPPLRLNSSMGM